MSKTFLSLCSKTWSRSDSPVSSFHADSRRQSGDRVRSRRSESTLQRCEERPLGRDLLKNLDLTPSSFPPRSLQSAAQRHLHQRTSKDCDRQDSEIRLARATECNRGAMSQRFSVGERGRSNVTLSPSARAGTFPIRSSHKIAI